MKNHSIKKSPSTDGFTERPYQFFEEFPSILLKLVHKIKKKERKEMLPNSFYEARIGLMSKWDKDKQNKITDQSQLNTCKMNSKYIKKITHYDHMVVQYGNQ